MPAPNDIDDGTEHAPLLLHPGHTLNYSNSGPSPLANTQTAASPGTSRRTSIGTLFDGQSRQSAAMTDAMNQAYCKYGEAKLNKLGDDFGPGASVQNSMHPGHYPPALASDLHFDRPSFAPLCNDGSTDGALESNACHPSPAPSSDKGTASPGTKASDRAARAKMLSANSKTFVPRQRFAALSQAQLDGPCSGQSVKDGSAPAVSPRVIYAGISSVRGGAAPTPPNSAPEDVGGDSDKKTSKCPVGGHPGKPADLPSPPTEPNPPAESRGEDQPSGPAPGIPNSQSWGPPAGLGRRDSYDQNLLVFRQAVGINVPHDLADDSADVEANTPLLSTRKLATGIYKRILHESRSKEIQYKALNWVSNICHVAQIVSGAVLVSLGSDPASHATAITTLGGANMVLAGLLAYLKSQGYPERLHKDSVGYRRVQEWIEETDAMLVAGVLGRDRKEIGLLVETAFKMYNAAVASVENNRMERYVHQEPEPTRGAAGSAGAGSSNPGGFRVSMAVARGTAEGARQSMDGYDDSNSMVRLNMPQQ